MIDNYTKILTMHGFNPEVLMPGDIVGFIIHNHFRVGKVKVGYNYEGDDKSQPWCVEGFDGKTYYPYTKDTVLLNSYVDAKPISVSIKEIE